MNTIRIKIRRCDKPGGQPYWEEFAVSHRPNMNVISALMAIRRNPVNAHGDRVAPVVWESNCLEEVCGACTMVINGRVRQACSALIDQLDQPIYLEPMSKFPTVRDLIVDRSGMFQALKTVKAWIPLDGSHHLGPGPKIAPTVQEKAYEYSRCMTCGCCLEACPQFNDRSSFMGAFAFGQVKLFNSHPTGAMNRDERLDAIMNEGGLAECGNAQNCVKACPKGIPLTEAIAELGWDTTKRALARLFKE
ncbi:MAG: succinate dehydrogenase iron-sulfur subunit [Deltaproteobacteria bacterium]|nr:succinate dehydrogenase iron-sulfur subunit [Deltaproteobacteria bacterium]